LRDGLGGPGSVRRDPRKSVISGAYCRASAGRDFAEARFGRVKIPAVRTARVYFAGAVLGGILVGTVWLYTSRDWQETTSPIWWAVLGILILPLIGAGISVWLLPDGRRLLRGFFSRLGGVFSAKPS